MSTNIEIKRATLSNSAFEFKFAAGSQPGTFSGYGSVFGNIDSHGDVVEKGAFTRTLQEFKAKGKMPKMLLQHGGRFGPVDDALPIGQWTSMAEDSKGLKVEGRLFGLNTDRGALIYEGLTSGEIDGLSIGYRAKKATMGTKPTEPYRTLQDVDLLEVSIVTWGSNDQALISSAKAQLDASEVKTVHDYERMLKGLGFPKRFAANAAEAAAAAGLFSSKATPEQIDDELMSFAAALKG